MAPSRGAQAPALSIQSQRKPARSPQTILSSAPFRGLCELSAGLEARAPAPRDRRQSMALSPIAPVIISPAVIPLSRGAKAPAPSLCSGHGSPSRRSPLKGAQHAIGTPVGRRDDGIVIPFAIARECEARNRSSQQTSRLSPALSSQRGDVRPARCCRGGARCAPAVAMRRPPASPPERGRRPHVNSMGAMNRAPTTPNG